MLNSASDKNRLLQDDIAVKAQALLTSLQAKDGDAASLIIHELAQINQDAIVQIVQQQNLAEFNKIARELQDLIKIIDVNHSDSIAVNKDRLNQIIAMTEEAANTTLDGIDLMMPLLGELREKSKILLDLWNKFQTRQMNVSEFNTYLLNIKNFMFEVADANDLIYKNLKEILLAQNFQDLSGQAIKKVITFIGQLETKLIGLTAIMTTIEMNASYDLAGDNNATEASASAPEVAQSGSVSGQNEVDDLLTSLGF